MICLDLCTAYLVTILLILNGIICENDDATAQVLPSAYSHENLEMDQLPHFTQPDQLHSEILKPSGHMLNIRCAATGDPEPSITWTKDLDVIKRVGEVKKRKWTLVLKNLTSDDSGHYECELCNIHGCIYHTTKLLVEGGEKLKSSVNTILDNTVSFKMYAALPVAANVNRLLFPISLTPSIFYCAVTMRKVFIVTGAIISLDSSLSVYTFCFLCVGGTFWLLTALPVSISLVLLIKPIRKWLWLNGNLLLNNLRTAVDDSATDSSWEFPRHRLTISKKPIGKGNFGLVYKATARGPLGKRAQRNVVVKKLIKIIEKARELLRIQAETNVAVKTLKENQSWLRLSCFLREIETMKIIDKHANIVNLLGCCTQDGPIYAIVEYAHLRDLRTYLVNRENRIGTETLISFARQVACGMEHLANSNCIHRDVAARNVLVFLRNGEITLKIADFGFARVLRESRYCHPLEPEEIPHRWRAPETLPYNIHEMKSDVYSCGVLFWEIMSFGSQPYPQCDDSGQLYNFLREGKRMNKPFRCPGGIYNLMKQCWQWEPRDRPSFGEIRNTLDGI